MTTLADGRVLVTGGDSVDTAELYARPRAASRPPRQCAPQIKGTTKFPCCFPTGAWSSSASGNGSLVTWSREWPCDGL